MYRYRDKWQKTNRSETCEDVVWDLIERQDTDWMHKVGHRDTVDVHGTTHLKLGRLLEGFNLENGPKVTGSSKRRWMNN